MNLSFILTILVVGISGLTAQALLLRELLVSFYGNELTLGLVLANWVVLEASGAYLIGKYIDRAKNKISPIITLEIIFSFLLPVSIYLSRSFKGVLGVAPGEAVGLSTIFFVSFIVILPLSFCHGGLFTASLSLQEKKQEASIGKVYIWETIGTIIGGIIFTYIFIPYLGSFQIAFIIFFINILICLLIISSKYKTRLIYSFLALIALSIFIFFGPAIRYLEEASVKQQFRPSLVLDYRNSVYGNIAVTKQEEQYTFFYNGVPVITTPYPDITFVEEFGNLPLLFSKSAKDILILSAGAGGLLNEVLKHPVNSIDYVELDPLIIEMLKIYSTQLTESELTERRVNIKVEDSRFYLRRTEKFYDVALIGLSNPSDLSTNRLFTREFFSLVKNRLKSDGILSLWLPGSLTYLNQELKDLNSCILNALKEVFEYVRIIPGDYNIYLASSSKDIMGVTPHLISQRIASQNIKTNMLIPNYLDYRLSDYWLDWFTKASSGATKRVNQDLKPIAVFEMLIFWNKKISPHFSKILEAFGGLNIGIVAAFILSITLLLLYNFKRARRPKSSIVYCIFTTGFFGMLGNLVLIFSFQTFYGYLYQRIGILIALFMAGIALGSIFIMRVIKNIKNKIKLFMKLEVLIILFTFIMSLTITKFLWFGHFVSLVFIALFFACGLFLGLEFPLASSIYLEDRRELGKTAGVLYGADLAGGWVAGIFGGVVLLPVLGLFNTCLIIILFKTSSLILLALNSRK